MTDRFTLRASGTAVRSVSRVKTRTMASLPPTTISSFGKAAMVHTEMQGC
jgi:hypothetical protein